MNDIPPFDAFYRAVHRGREPLPWQHRLAEHVAAEGWPRVVGIPTGLGKTASLDIGVWALASQHGRSPAERTLPTRIWYVVNRRLLVDAATDHGLLLRGLLGDPASLGDHWRDCGQADIGCLEAVGQALRSMAALGSDHGPLHVARLRGGAVLGARVPDPSQPALVFATVPMFASRWLFQGHGSSRSMRPIDAALAGIDTLVLLDESHLARPLRDLQEPIAACDLGDATRAVPPRRARPTFVELTATADPGADTFDLTDEDRLHPVVATRLGARKPTIGVPAKKRTLTRVLVSEALELLRAEQPLTVVVFVNTASRARDVTNELRARLRDEVELVLLTGRVREPDGQSVRDRLLDEATGVPAGRQDSARQRSLVVVATQTLEVGADVDFDRLVTETAGTRALVQRFGRLNRLGHRNAQAMARICHPTDERSWPVYGEEPAAVWARLEKVEEPLDLGPARITDVLGEPDDVPPRTAELLPELLWEWAKTSAPPPDAAPIEPFVDGFDDAGFQASVAWRVYLPDIAAAEDAEDVQLFPRLRASEVVELPLSELRDTLSGRGVETVHRLVDGAVLQIVAVEAIRPGDQVVLPARVGCYDAYGWNPQHRGEVPDLSPFESGVLVLDRSLLGHLLESLDEDLVTALKAVVNPPDDVDPSELDSAVQVLLSRLRLGRPAHAVSRDAWLALVEPLRSLVDEPGLPPYLRGAATPRQLQAAVAADAFDELSFTARSVRLDDHQDAVARAAGRVLVAIGAEPALQEVVELAGKLHDVGKVDPRFQRWLDPEGVSVGVPIAKSSSPRERRTAVRIASGWPRGGRHELLSARLVERWLEKAGPMTADDELVVHLVASHHGHGRPSIDVAHDDTPTRVTADVNGQRVGVTGDLAAHDWSQPARFRALCEHYGYWGLALLEAAVRQADHAASSQVDAGTATMLEVR